MSKKMFRDKKRQKRDEALSTVVPPTATTRYKHIRVTTATFWRWRSLAQELGLDGDEQMASFLLNTYYERAVEAASQEQRQDIPPNSEESRQIVETSMFPDDEQGTETDAIGSTSTTLPMQATQDGSIGLLLTEPPPDSMKEQVEDDWRGGDGDKTNDGGEMVLEGKFTCLIKTEPHESGEESNEQEALPSVSQQGDSLTGDDRKEIEEVEFKCLIKEEPDDGEHNQPSCSQQGGDSRGQRSHHKESALIISGDPSVDTSHDGPRGEHLPEDFPIQTILGNLAGLSARGSYSGGDSRGQRSHHKESALTMSGDPSGDTSHDRPRGEHLPEDFPIQTVLGNLAGLSARGSYSGEYDSHLLPNQGNYATDSATMSDDHEEERLNLKTDAIGLGEKCETASSKQKSSQISSTRTKQSNPCINSAGEQLFTCSVCQKGYNRKHNLYRHMRLHSGERPHECTYCKKRFWQSSELKRHLRIHTGQKPYSCSVCDKQFRFSSNLKKHMAVHLRKRRKYQCAFCDEGFSTRALRDAHSASAHPSGDSRRQSSHHKESALKMSGDPSGDTSHDGPRGEHLPEDFPIQTVLGNLAGLSTRGSFSSEYGAHLLPNQGDYSQWQSPTMSDDHKEGRLDLKTDNARELDEKCESASSENKSSNVSSTSTNQTNLCINQQLFTCSVCQKGYNRKHNLYRHMRLHSGERPHECTYCKKRFWQSSELKRHLRIHTGQKPYSCSVCDKQFRDTSNLKVHMAVHLRKKRKYQCSFCDEGFSTRALRDTHSASAHPSEKPFHCMECDMRFCRRGSLQVHIWRTHTARDKPHVCSFCNKAFSHLCFLRTHKRIHTGEKPYECTVCGDRFSFHTQLADHKAKHTGVKPYSCSICEKRFWRKSCLNRHQRTHTGKKPFQCPECKKGFAEKGTLIKHLNTHPNL